MPPTLSGRFLIVAKTYPSPSMGHRETSCVAAFHSDGTMARLFPIPFRLLSEAQQFRKWEWVDLKYIKAPHDHRPESLKVWTDTIARTNLQVDTADAWGRRLDRIQPHLYSSPLELEAERLNSGVTLGFVAPDRMAALEIRPSPDIDWSPKELEALTRQDLLDPEDVANRRTIEKIPYDFYYRYVCQTDSGPVEFKHKITDWEFAMLYLNCKKSHGEQWEQAFRQKVETEFFQSKQLILLLGTIHRFPKQWLVVGVSYPPAGALNRPRQLGLL